jgi:DNA segregation ATPase FtsK/SpoIIIE-like protein
MSGVRLTTRAGEALAFWLETDDPIGVSFIQRRLLLGFGGAMQIIDELHKAGMIENPANNPIRYTITPAGRAWLAEKEKEA